MAKVDVIKAQVSVTDRRRRSKSIERKRVAAYCRVSTDSEDQLNSYRSQVQYYTDKISENVDWMMAGIYADEAITGTQVAKREGFQKMINGSACNRQGAGADGSAHQSWQQELVRFNRSRDYQE